MVRVSEDLGGRDCRITLVFRVVVAHHLVGPLEQLVPIVLRYTDQIRDRLERQLAGDLLHEVARAFAHSGVDDAPCTTIQLVAHAVDRARREQLRNQLAEFGVLRRILVEQKMAEHLDGLARHVVGETRDRGVLPAREHIAALADLFDVSVTRDHPVPLVLESADRRRLLTPPHGCVATQFGELLERDPLPEDSRVGDVESGRQVRCACCVRDGHGVL